MVAAREPVGMLVVANGVTRADADRLRRTLENAVVSRNSDGTYRVTTAR